MLGSKGWMDHTSQTRLFGRSPPQYACGRPMGRSSLETRIDERPPKRGDRAARLKEIRDEWGNVDHVVSQPVIYNGRRWVLIENYDPRKRYN